MRGMTNRDLLLKFLDEYESQAEAAKVLGVSEAQISRLVNGQRKLTARLAERIEEITNGRYCKAALLWGDKDILG